VPVIRSRRTLVQPDLIQPYPKRAKAEKEKPAAKAAKAAKAEKAEKPVAPKGKARKGADF
jgi:hypothetical protein